MHEELKSEMMNEYLHSKPRLGMLIIGLLIALAGVIVGFTYLALTIINLIVR